MDDYNKITELLKDNPELQSKTAYHKTYEEVLEILSLRETCDPRFRYLFTANIWKTYPKNIKSILNMPEWDNPKYKHLLTPSIWNRSYSEVKHTLAMPEWEKPKYEHLLTPSVWQCSYKNIKTILNLKEWKLNRYKYLLTSSIWTSSPEQISPKLNMSCFKLSQYKHLLTPGIFAVTEQNINDNILLFEEYDITKYIMPNNIRINANDQRLLIEYMVNNNIPLVVRGKLNEIIRNPIKKTLDKYGINLKQLRKTNEDKVLEKVK